jgi:hypothetical protein
MSNCSQCGISIPSDQRFCSMCYGDPYYGHDGYYLKWLEDQAEEEAQSQWEIENQPQPEPEQEQ